MLEAIRCKRKPIPFPNWLELQNIVSRWNRNLKTRRTLCELDDWQLEDVGIDRNVAAIEGAKRFWQ